jgi:hypothetical protein
MIVTIYGGRQDGAEKRDAAYGRWAGGVGGMCRFG